MKMYYVTRFEQREDKPTEYYYGGGQWMTCKASPEGWEGNERIMLRLYKNENLAKCVADEYTESDWHEIEIVD